MKKFGKFIKRKLEGISEGILITLLVIPVVSILFILMALPGAIIAFLIGCNPDVIHLSGILSLIVIAVIWAIISKVKKLIEEYKRFDE